MNNYNDQISAVYDPKKNIKSNYNQNYNDVEFDYNRKDVFGPFIRLECLSGYQNKLLELMDTLTAKLQPVIYSDVDMKAEQVQTGNIKIGPEIASSSDSILAQSIVNCITIEKTMITNLQHLIDNIEL
jgi:hypothetical protein